MEGTDLWIIQIYEDGSSFCEHIADKWEAVIKAIKIIYKYLKLFNLLIYFKPDIYLFLIYTISLIFNRNSKDRLNLVELNWVMLQRIYCL